jgi:hypothetical protein
MIQEIRESGNRTGVLETFLPIRKQPESLQVFTPFDLGKWLLTDAQEAPYTTPYKRGVNRLGRLLDPLTAKSAISGFGAKKLVETAFLLYLPYISGGGSVV